MSRNYSAGVSHLKSQYRDSSNLSARQRIYRFATDGGKPFADFILDHVDLPADARVLDIGCGNATLWSKRAERIPPGWRTVLADQSNGMLIEARSAVRRSPAYRFVRCDVQELPFTQESFDGVVANHMLYHVPDRHRAFHQIARVLKPAGRVYATTNGEEHLRRLKDLIDRFVPEPFDMGGGGSIEWFSLESGAAQLEKYFADVTVARVRGELRVTEAQAIVDYVTSIEPAKPIVVGEVLEGLRAMVEGEIEREGAFVIATEVGMFRGTRRG